MIPLVNLRPAIEETATEWRALIDAMFARGHFILGDQVAAFEREFAQATGANFSIGVGTGTAALELCLRSAGVARREQEVITSPLTAPFTALAILSAGATTRFADVDPETLLLDPGDAEDRIRKRTAAIMPVHLYGQPCELDRLAKLAKRSGATLVQDACQAHGARYRARPLTSYSPYVAYSFYPTKNLGCLGDGGAVATGSRPVDKRIRLLRDGGRTANHVSVVAGVNSRLDEMQACYLSAFLKRLDAWNARRRALAALYDDAFGNAVSSGMDAIKPLRVSADSVRHLYVVRVARREKLREFLTKRGIGTGVHYPVPLHLQPAFSGCGSRRGDLPHAERAAREILSLPLWPHLEAGAVEQVVEAVLQFYRSAAPAESTSAG